MKKLDLGQSITILANLGVIAGIVFLGVELNQNRVSVQGQTRANISDTLVDMLFQQASNPELSQLMVKVSAGEPLTDVEARRYRDLQIAYWRYRENVSYQHRNGLYDESEYVSQRRTWIQFINSNDLVRTIWCDRESRSPEVFFEEINSLIERPCE